MTVIKTWRDKRTGALMRSVKDRHDAVHFERLAEPLKSLKGDEGRWIAVEG